MAQLHVLGDWHGPGEERAVRRLAADLPDDWDVLAGRQIPDPMGPVDLDLVVVGRNGVYVCEEKAWGRHVVAGEVAWYVNGEKWHSPANQVAHATRVLASRLRAKVDGWAQGRRRLQKELRPVSGHVVLSHPSLNLEEADEPGSDAVLPLDDAAPALLTRDAALGDGMAQLRPKLMSYLLGLGCRPPAEKPQQMLSLSATRRPAIQASTSCRG